MTQGGSRWYAVHCKSFRLPCPPRPTKKKKRWLAEPWQHVRIIEPCPYTAHHGGVMCCSRHCGHSGSGDGEQVSLGAALGPRTALAQCAHMLGTENINSCLVGSLPFMFTFQFVLDPGYTGSSLRLPSHPTGLTAPTAAHLRQRPAWPRPGQPQWLASQARAPLEPTAGCLQACCPLQQPQVVLAGSIQGQRRQGPCRWPQAWPLPWDPARHGL